MSQAVGKEEVLHLTSFTIPTCTMMMIKFLFTTSPVLLSRKTVMLVLGWLLVCHAGVYVSAFHPCLPRSTVSRCSTLHPTYPERMGVRGVKHQTKAVTTTSLSVSSTRFHSDCRDDDTCPPEDDEHHLVSLSSSSSTLGQSFRITTALLSLAAIWYLFTTWQHQPHHGLVVLPHYPQHVFAAWPTSKATPTAMSTAPPSLAEGIQYVLHFGQRTWVSYQRVLNTSPVATKAATSAFVYALGDVIAQSADASSSTMDEGNDVNLEGQPTKPLDLVRTLKSLIAGGLGHGPLSHVWYNLSESFFLHHPWPWHVAGAATATAASLSPISASWWAAVLPKIVADQAIWGPIWTSLYLTMLGIMNGQGPKAIQQSIQTSLIPLTLQGLALWPAAHIVTYGFIPVQDRLLWVDLVEIVWVTILATQAASSMPPPQHNILPPHDPEDGDESSAASLLVRATETGTDSSR